MKLLTNQRGFTLTELITVIVIVGIISVAALPRFFDQSGFESRGFRDQVVATLRHAQKVAIAQHRFVCVAFTANTITLTYDPVPPSAAYTTATCPGNALTSPAGATPYTVTAPGGVILGGFVSPMTMNFDALGKPSAAQSITVTGSTAITIEAETGYVH
ncbi:prepilin-type N-terminal cleavage/methylation domain-containing protein [Sideroxyarcus sp. TK5]